MYLYDNWYIIEIYDNNILNTWVTGRPQDAKPMISAQFTSKIKFSKQSSGSFAKWSKSLGNTSWSHEVSHEAVLICCKRHLISFAISKPRPLISKLGSLDVRQICCYELQIWPRNPSTTLGRSPRSSSLPPRTLYDFPPRTCPSTRPCKMTKDYATWRLASACSDQLQQTFKFRSRKHTAESQCNLYIAIATTIWHGNYALKAGHEAASKALPVCP